MVNQLLNALYASGRLDPLGWQQLHDHLKGLDLLTMKTDELAQEIDLTVRVINERLRSEKESACTE